MQVIRKVIIPMAGFGTRLLLMSKAIPKEMVPVVGRPLIQHVVDEALAAGINEIILASRTGKSAIEDHLDAHVEFEQSLATLQAERLESWVDLRIGDLEAWEDDHLNSEDAEKPSRWYPVSLLEGVEQVDLLWVDGPPEATCLFSRYPALPALADKLAPTAEVWMDDTIRQEEKDICERWAKDHGFELEFYPLEKGLGRLTRPGASYVALAPKPLTAVAVSNDDTHPEHALLGLDFSLPEVRR